MAQKLDYSEKFESFESYQLYGRIGAPAQTFIRQLADRYRLTFQEFKEVVDAQRDLTLWGEDDLVTWWHARKNGAGQTPSEKTGMQQDLRAYYDGKKNGLKEYPEEGTPRPAVREKKEVSRHNSDKQIHGMCPVASEETVCCNLRTIDAVENCAFGCSYCTIQTFYNDRFIFDADFIDKLNAIEIDPDRFYHFGTGQSSDSLVWGNKYGILDALCKFAASHPNILLELKTKSDNISYLLENPIPANVVCSWSLNTETIVRNEEHFTARLRQRLTAARRVADRGVKVAFHFHPMVYYRGWAEDYPAIAAGLIGKFDAAEVLFLSFGSVTMIKPAIKKIRQLGHATKILQMPMVPDPHGKLTYPDDIKVEMFHKMYQAFNPWHRKVFMYLCMEKTAIWERTFGFVYPTNVAFEIDFGAAAMSKVNLPAAS